ncbi:hypothetical protein EYF80_017624 [Liparis tanakae]|uniref:Uncharacterized protein n=1 Tax=Liparis tanakae TaxID=230148 RepID=A0A4Z2I295_9TELE|nr:hypothetical protein EYF80_017624 [Liparis tanakae]
MNFHWSLLVVGRCVGHGDKITRSPLASKHKAPMGPHRTSNSEFRSQCCNDKRGVCCPDLVPLKLLLWEAVSQVVMVEQWFQPTPLTFTVGVHEHQHLSRSSGSTQSPAPPNAQALGAADQTHPFQMRHIFTEHTLHVT